MFLQRLETLVGLRECVCHLACGWADLRGRLNYLFTVIILEATKHLSKLGVRHQRIFVGLCSSNQRFLLVHHIDQVLLQQGQVQL